jgi:hypothetical protein
MDIVRLAVPEEKISKAIVYYRTEPLQAGERVQLGRQSIEVKSQSQLFFIDLEPGVNWGHKCKYIIAGADGKIIENIDSQFPPMDDKLEVLHKPENAEDWMLI